jgi:hypothetical protein
MRYFGVTQCWRRMKDVRSLWLLALAIGVAMPVAAHAQTQVSAYVNFGATLLTDPTASHTLYGTNAGVSFDLMSAPKVSLGMDFRGGFAEEAGGSGASFTSGLLGPKVSTRIKRFKPYGEFLIGFARYNDGLGNPASKTTDTDVALNAGVDMGLTKHIDWRVFEYGWSKFLGLGGELNPRSYSTGIVVHFP